MINIGKDSDILQLVLDKMGIEHESLIACEECSELIEALLHYRRGKNKKADVITEIADVFICANILANHYGEDLVQEEIKKKIDQLILRYNTNSDKL